jgi:uncharacterized lipoprotein YajG
MGVFGFRKFIRKKMNTILKTILAMAAATVLFTGCSVEDTLTIE